MRLLFGPLTGNALSRVLSLLLITSSSVCFADFAKELENVAKAAQAISDALNQTSSSPTQSGSSTQPGTTQSTQAVQRTYEGAKIEFMLPLAQVKEVWGNPTRISNKDRRYEFENKAGDLFVVYVDREGATMLNVLKLASDVTIPNYKLEDFLEPSYPSYRWRSFSYRQKVNGKEIPYKTDPYGQQRLISSHGKFIALAIGKQGLDYHTAIVFDSSLYDLMIVEGYNPFSWGNTDPVDQYLYGSSGAITPGVSNNSTDILTPPVSSGESDLKRGDWRILQDTGDEIFPSMVIGMSQFSKIVKDKNSAGEYHGDYIGILGAEVVSPKYGQKVTVTISGTSFIKPSTLTATLGRPGETLRIYPLLEYDYDKLLKLRQPRPETLTFTVQFEGGAKETRTKRIHFRSINDCPLLGRLILSEKKEESLDQLFACYVNENHPIVDEILGECLKTDMLNAFTGYQEGNPKSVEDQVMAIWHVLQKRGVKYSSITTPSMSGGIPSQHVRFIHESLKNSQANCVDGSVLLCSLLRKIGINSELILVPGHCFIAYHTDSNGRNKVYLETTMLGNVDLAKVEDPDFKVADSVISFYEAQEAAHETAKKYLFSSLIRDSGQFVQVDIAKARKNGFMPLPVE